jgi:RNA polymerase sigma factor (sigma-70 family)
MNGSETTDASPTRQGRFVTTHWSVVLQARDKASAGSQEALETLCQTYWYPGYAFIRSQGHRPEDAQDLTQEFFARLLSKDFLQAARPEKGRFRTFLRVALKRFLANEWDRVRAQKRGGGAAHVSFDTSLAEERLQSEQSIALAPDQIYDRRWALALLDEAMTRLEREYATANKDADVRHLKPHLLAVHGSIPYAEIAAALQTSEGAARVAVHRFRKRFRELFREAVADTVGEADEVEGEIRYVLEILGKG